MIAPCNIESVLNPVQCLKKNEQVQESDFCSIYTLGSLIKWKIKIICEKENSGLWFHSVPTFLTSSSPVTRELYIRLENLWKCSTICDIKNEETSSHKAFQR